MNCFVFQLISVGLHSQLTFDFNRPIEITDNINPPPNALMFSTKSCYESRV